MRTATTLPPRPACRPACAHNLENVPTMAPSTAEPRGLDGGHLYPRRRAPLVQKRVHTPFVDEGEHRQLCAAAGPHALGRGQRRPRPRPRSRLWPRPATTAGALKTLAAARRWRRRWWRRRRCQPPVAHSGDLVNKAPRPHRRRPFPANCCATRPTSGDPPGWGWMAGTPQPPSKGRLNRGPACGAAKRQGLQLQRLPLHSRGSCPPLRAIPPAACPLPRGAAPADALAGRCWPECCDGT